MYILKTLGPNKPILKNSGIKNVCFKNLDTKHTYSSKPGN